MEVDKIYSSTNTQNKWYKIWLENKHFASSPDEREPYTIVIPPPNVTGVLHMGHMLNNTLQDVLIRKARLQGKNACWVPGTDHASIATEAKVVSMLREKNIKKSSLTRDEFMHYAWEWKNKYGGIILEQLKKMGASVDWDRVHFTMDDAYYKAVIRVFVDLYNKRYIYRGYRMINWDCEAKTALSNEEVLYNEEGENSTLYHVKYAIKDSTDYIVIATQRPETIMGDTAIAVNPHDERYSHLIGKKILVPFIHREIPVIADTYVEKDFGSGCLKVTPAHDVNDYEIGQRHQLPIIDTLNDDGTLNEACEMPEMVGIDRFEARKRIIKKLKEADLIIKEESFVTRIGRSERTNTVVEPRLSLQWFVRMKDLVKPALDAVENKEVVLHPAKFKNTYRHWMENVRDWCVSRQLWWGHRIPAYYYGEGENDFVVAENEEEALTLIIQKTGNKAITAKDLKQDEDVLDTWASSWIWPLAVFDGFNDACFDRSSGKVRIEKNSELAYYYPTQVLVTAPEILFFWVARMIISGYEYTDKKPFTDVYLTGIVRDKLGRKMSKSLGNSPDPLELIEKYSADGMRVGMLLCSPAGNDLPFDESLCEQGRNFANKLWNAYRLVHSWQKDENAKPTEAAMHAVKWMKAKMQKNICEINDLFEKYRISEALMVSYKLVWDDFCAWYLEIIKPPFGQAIDKQTWEETITIFEQLLKLLHPFMPFITEEIWHQLTGRKESETIMYEKWPETNTITQTDILNDIEKVQDLVAQIRQYRMKAGLSFKDEISLLTNKPSVCLAYQSIVSKLCNISGIQVVTEKPLQITVLMADNTEFYIPMPEAVNIEAEKEKLEKEIAYLKGFLASVEKKLSNDKFMGSAPEQVIENEKKKKSDAEIKLSLFEEQLDSFKK